MRHEAHLALSHDRNGTRLPLGMKTALPGNLMATTASRSWVWWKLVGTGEARTGECPDANGKIL